MATVLSTTPEKEELKNRKRRAKNEEIEVVIRNLNDQWDLRLPVPELGQSPNKVQKCMEQNCVNMIKVLAFKNEVFDVLSTFKEEAHRLYKGWVSKPRAERGIVPDATRQHPRPITPTERIELLRLLYESLRVPVDGLKDTFTPRSARSLGISLGGLREEINDSPLPFPLIFSHTKDKRARGELVDDLGHDVKKMKTPPVEALSRKPTNSMLPPPRGKPFVQEHNGYRSAGQSFDSISTSNAGCSIFSRGPSFTNPVLQSTQETIPDLGDLQFQTQEITPTVTTEAAIEKMHPSSDYGAGSSFEALLGEVVGTNGALHGNDAVSESIDDVLSQELMNVDVNTHIVWERANGEDALQERISQVFPKLAPSLEQAPMAIKYEITRVFQHADVLMTTIDFPWKRFTDYDYMWKFLKGLPALEGKPFPEKSNKNAWEAAQGDFNSGSNGVVLSGSLQANSSSLAGPLFRFHLNPLRLDRTHRLDRRHGSHRFLELEMPHLSGDQVPKSISGGHRHDLILDWLVDQKHALFGRIWKPFHTKRKDRDRRRDGSKDESGTAHVVYFFAIDGSGINLVPSPGKALQSLRLDIHALLDTVRLGRKNEDESYLKLFARTSLAVSRNTATVVLEPEQIIYKDDIHFNGERMTDGAGLISPSLAHKVSNGFGLNRQPTGFQGRIGQAKGFWTIDWREKEDIDWIEIRKSQCKWKRSKSRTNMDHHPCNRTFEVIESSAPMKSAEINLQFLPLLMDRAINKSEMKVTLAHLLEKSLRTKLEELLCALDNGPSLRQWTYERSPNFKERLKHQQVPYQAGLPATLEERLTMFLDAGFEPKKIKFVADAATRLFELQCNELKKRLKFTIVKSANAFMVPDFWGVLGADEVFINFSDFSDDSGYSNVDLDKKDVLVARSPAHFNSDIQKVKVVFKEELRHLKDVIVFPVKGNPSLAQKLSGGDYDGDRAWICWEPSIVQNFKSAEPPKQPDLVGEGYIHQDKTTYAELVSELPNSRARISHFLKKSFAFNMQQSMLGICTGWKEKVCYTDGSVDTEQAIYLSTLLSSLVDEAKQGYIFTDADWKRFRNDKVKTKPFECEYKKDNPHLKPNSRDIIDYLFYKVQEVVEACMTSFHSQLPKDIPSFDDDCLWPYKWMVTQSTLPDGGEWKVIIKDLITDLEPLKKKWSAFYDRKQLSKVRGQSFGSKNDLETSSADENLMFLDLYNEYLEVLPHNSTLLTRSLLLDSPETSLWALLKSSALLEKNRYGQFAWKLAGNQLARAKANAISTARGAMPHSIIPGMYVVYKPNNSYIKHARGEVAGSELDLEELGEMENDG
ncbi:RNA dependent RNA polymerase-domain-containing protein [Tricladium varicosporioides]|nr:RNA dependent RNA polymerase-domain-containing protein [Hymenoscyphus varicosporioides]